MFGKKDQGNPSDIQMFTIYDSKTQSYEMPSFAVNQHDLVRQLINMFSNVDQKNNKFYLNAEDFAIFKIGTYDRYTGKLVAHNPEHVANLHDLRTTADLNKKQDLDRVGIVPT